MNFKKENVKILYISQTTLEGNKIAFTFGPGVFPLANCRHGVLIHWRGLKNRGDQNINTRLNVGRNSDPKVIIYFSLIGKMPKTQEFRLLTDLLVFYCFKLFSKNKIFEYITRVNRWAELFVEK